ncbi:MAG: hypothetical protein HY927_09940 [Elusimicrobia bacterium]|nr:hypothetical protein [Elusimicrobiota bacterium]
MEPRPDGGAGRRTGREARAIPWLAAVMAVLLAPPGASAGSDPAATESAKSRVEAVVESKVPDQPSSETGTATGDEASSDGEVEADDKGETGSGGLTPGQLRRRQRRAARRERALQRRGEDASEADEAVQESIMSKGLGAVSNAMKAGDALKNSFQPADVGGLPAAGDLPGELGMDGRAGGRVQGGQGAGPGPGGLNDDGKGSGPSVPAGGSGLPGAAGETPRPSGAASAGGGAGRGDPSNPRTTRDLVVAVQGGYRASLDASGLKLVRGASGAYEFRRKDGSPATPQDLVSLQRRIESEPAALMRRPDFFQAIPRERYQDLKSDHRGKPELKDTAFKDVGTTANDRDFVWEKSCSKVSGDCNPAAKEGEYKKNEDVPPEDLDSIWKSIYGTADTFLEGVLGEKTGKGPASSAGDRVSGSLMGRMLGRVRGAMGWGQGSGDTGDDAAPVVGETGQGGVAGPGGSAGSLWQGGGEAAGRSGSRRAGPAGGTRLPRFLWLSALAGAALVVLAAALRGRRREEDRAPGKDDSCP